MPVTVVVGGQFGSEGKGKVAHWLAREESASAALRVGGPNSGHTVIRPSGEAVTFRQIPTAAILPDVQCFIAAGSYIDPEVFLSEIEAAPIEADRIAIDPHAMVIGEEDKAAEQESRLRDRIGSTLSGTGAAVKRRIDRHPDAQLAKNHPELAAFTKQIQPVLRKLLDRGGRLIVEGTQGFGLSLLHGSDYPNVTSRDTTAAAFLSEAGLSPLDVDDIVLVVRAFPIRVPGNSGNLPYEIDWDTITQESGRSHPVAEYTSVTQALRRVARFDSGVMRAAIAANQPTRIALNHLDYVDCSVSSGHLTSKALQFAIDVGTSITRSIDLIGLSRSSLMESPPHLRRGHGQISRCTC